MTSHCKREFCESAKPHPEGVFRAMWIQPAKSSYTWKEIFGGVEDEDLTSEQTCEINSAQLHVPAVDADEFESVYLWFLA